MHDAYFTNDCCLCKNGKEGAQQLTNFVARIVRELIYHDGNKTSTHLQLEGMLQDLEVDEEGNRKHPDGVPLPEITIPATEFAGLGWVPDQWGMRPIVYPVPGSERDIRTAIQAGSRPDKRHIYTHTGWTIIGKQPAYLHSRGAITAKGNDPTINVQLPHELSRYSLPDPEPDNAEAFKDSLRLVNLGPPEVLWPILLATYRAAIGPSDFALHLTGRTGTYKSEVASLFQSHYGEGMDGRHLPGSWLSTSNANEALAYRAKDALFCVDDFVPTGTAYHVRNLQKAADNLIRGQGNQAGRSRLTDVSNLQTTNYPRGLTFSTGEDTPEGHSVRGRMLILETQPGMISPAKLTTAQQKRSQYPIAMAGWIQWLATVSAKERLAKLAADHRDKHLGVGHSRTPAIMGQLIATAQLLMDYAADQQFLTVEQINDIYNKAEAAVIAAGQAQLQHIEAADPVEAVKDTIRLLLGAQMAHLKTPNGGIPTDAVRYGWSEEVKAGTMPTYKSNGPRLGWVDAEAGELLLDANAVTLLKKHSGGKLAITPQTLLKRMKESGTIIRCDDTRKRSTVRMMLEGHRRQAICLSLADVFEENDNNGT